MSPRKILRELPVGSKIKCNNVILTKVYNAQFKRNCWYDSEKNQYISSRYIPFEYEIIA